MAKQATNDPKGFAKEQATEAVADVVIGALLLPVIILVLFLAFLFVLSYTHLLGGPYGIARFFFWLLVVVYASGGAIVYTIYATFRKAFQSRSSRQDPHSMRDAEIVE